MGRVLQLMARSFGLHRLVVLHVLRLLEVGHAVPKRRHVLKWRIATFGAAGRRHAKAETKIGWTQGVLGWRRHAKGRHGSQ